MERLLVVDDERPIAEILQFNLERAGYQVSVAFNGSEALARFEEEQPHLVILDIMLPQMDGWEVCQAIRRKSSVPILMLTARDGEQEKVQGLELGADDYVVKPFSPREIVARVRALLRRSQGTTEILRDGSIEQGELRIEMSTHEVFKRGKKLDLTVREYELLLYLMLRPGQVFTRETLLEEVWGYEYYGDIRTVDVTVRRLREKIEDEPSNPQYLVTRRGVGYLLRVPA